MKGDNDMNEKNNSLNVEKKDIIGYILSILVIFIHTTSFFYYQELSGNECMTDINLTLKIILKNTVSLSDNHIRKFFME